MHNKRAERPFYMISMEVYGSTKKVQRLLGVTMTQADEVDCYGGLQRMVKERLMAMVA